MKRLECVGLRIDPSSYSWFLEATNFSFPLEEKQFMAEPLRWLEENIRRSL